MNTPSQGDRVCEPTGNTTDEILRATYAGDQERLSVLADRQSFIEESVFTSQAHFYLIFARGLPYILERKRSVSSWNRSTEAFAAAMTTRAVGTFVPLLDIQNRVING